MFDKPTTPLKHVENRHVDMVADVLLKSCAYHAMKTLLIRMRVASDIFQEDILTTYFS